MEADKGVSLSAHPGQNPAEKVVEAELIDSPIAAVLNGSCSESKNLESKEVMNILLELVDRISCEETNVSQLSDASTFVASVPNENGFHSSESKETSSDSTPSKSWGIGVSQTGRIIDPICLQQNIFSSIKPENLVEYQWPPDNSGDYYMLQEQLSTFLNITSFKRKYPEIQRRKLDPAEVNHLLSSHVISEVQVTLGLTALKSSDVCDMMAKEYPDKYKEYSLVMQEREKQKLQNRYKQYASSANAQVEKSQMPGYTKRAMRQAAEYNANLNRQRREEFYAYYDTQTNVIQYPKHKIRKLDPELTRPSLYPCALIPGQFQEYCKKYTKNELMYLPLNTAVYGPPQGPISNNDVESSGSEIDSEPDSVTSLSSAPRSVRSVSSAKPKDKSASARSSVIGETQQPMDTGDVEVIATVKDEVLQAGLEEDEQEGRLFDPVCGICGKDATSNKRDEAEDLIKCSQCDNHGHPSCLELSDELVSVILTYNWQCMECKTCTICSMPHREDLMMFCDRCDRGYHTFCVSLRSIPSGVWACSRCTHADPDFIRRRRKLVKTTQGGAGGNARRRGGKRRRQRKNDPKEANADQQSEPDAICEDSVDSAPGQSAGEEADQEDVDSPGLTSRAKIETKTGNDITSAQAALPERKADSEELAEGQESKEGRDLPDTDASADRFPGETSVTSAGESGRDAQRPIQVPS